MQVRDIMTSNPGCCLPTDSLRTAAQHMVECNCGLLPVVDNMQQKHLVGVITDRDMVCRIIAPGKDCSAATVQEAMTTKPLRSVKPTDSIDTVIEDMEQARVRRVVVVDENQGVTGVVSLADIAKEVEEESKVAEVLEEISQPAGTPRA